MIRRSTWVLLAALVVVALAYAVLQRTGVAGSGTATTAPEAPAWDLTADQVQSLRVVDHTADRVVVVERDADQGWRISSPTAAPADVGAVEAGVASLVSATVRQRLDAPSDLSTFGLDPAAYTLTFLRADGTSVSVDVGQLDPTGSVYYARIAGETGMVMLSRYSLQEALGWPSQPPVAAPTATPEAADLTPTPG